VEIQNSPHATHAVTRVEEAKAWLSAHKRFPTRNSSGRAGHVASATEAEGYMEFVHRGTGEVVVWEVPTAASKCTRRPDCPCDFCVRVRAKITGGRSEKDEQNKITEDFLRSYSQTKLLG
jgi:hypothetical protein